MDNTSALLDVPCHPGFIYKEGIHVHKYIKTVRHKHTCMNLAPTHTHHMSQGQIARTGVCHFPYIHTIHILWLLPSHLCKSPEAIIEEDKMVL